MPIHEQDPWRDQYFVGVQCPSDVYIPTDDEDAYRWNPRHRWIYNKLSIAASQGIGCAPHGVQPPAYPVFSKPTYNLKGMGVGSRVLRNEGEYRLHETPGHMWSTLLQGDHISTDLAVVDGIVRWSRHTIGKTLPGGTFDYWTVHERLRACLDVYLARWVESYLSDYVGMLNIETIGGRIIEAHLRFADQWPDLYGSGWLASVIRLYARGRWEFDDAERKPGYSVVLFAPSAGRYLHPPGALQRRIRDRRGVSSLQITFHENKPTYAHSMPPGGFRLAIVNCWDLAVGFQARDELAQWFGLQPPAAGASIESSSLSTGRAALRLL